MDAPGRSPHSTAAHVVRALADVAGPDWGREFSEFELTVAAWKRYPAIFGLRGFNDTYPDHKRVYMELIASRDRSLLKLGYLARIRPNYFRATELGAAVSAGLADPCQTEQWCQFLQHLLGHPARAAWAANPTNPRRAADIRGLFRDGLTATTAGALVEKIMLWCNGMVVSYVAPFSSGAAVHARELGPLLDFLAVVEGRFGKTTFADK